MGLFDPVTCYKERRGGQQKYDVLYVGMAVAGRCGGIKGRLTYSCKEETNLDGTEHR
jgi:hypothetical protein